MGWSEIAISRYPGRFQFPFNRKGAQMARFVWCWLGISVPLIPVPLHLISSGDLLAQPDYGHLDAPAQRLIAAVKPTPAELRWQQVPWEIHLQEAIDAARKEKRPIFLWAAGGRNRDGVPLERC
jgi:hypothetical protein